MSTPSPQYCRLDLAPPLADRFIVGVAPIDDGPVLLLKPFGFHLAMDPLPSGAHGGSRSALAVSGFRLRARVGGFHTFRTLRPARHYPRFWIWRSSFERQRDFNPPEPRAAQHTLPANPTSTVASAFLRNDPSRPAYSIRLVRRSRPQWISQVPWCFPLRTCRAP